MERRFLWKNYSADTGYSNGENDAFLESENSVSYLEAIALYFLYILFTGFIYNIRLKLLKEKVVV